MKFSGRVLQGRMVARGLGYPTANIEVADSPDTPGGVYAARVSLDGTTYNAMGYLKGCVLELHLFGFEGDLYGKTLSADLVRFIRPEQKFDTPAALRAQIKKDKSEIEKILVIRN